MSERIRPFSSGSQYGDWKSSNCARCKKFDPNCARPEACEIDYAVGVAYLDDGTVSVEIARRMGYCENHGKYLWMCPEVEWTEEWKKKCKEKSVSTETLRFTTEGEL